MASKKEEKTVTLSNNTITYVLVGLLIVASFAIGMLWTKVQDAESGNTGVQPVAQVAPEPEENPAVKVDPVTDSDHVRGSRDAKIALIEYSDFECSYCLMFHPTAQQVVDEYDGQVMWVYRHFPLDSIHPKAQKYGEATECAAKLGGEDKFWELGETLFEEATPLADLGELAGSLGLDQNAFTECLDSDEMADVVKEQAISGAKAGVRGTPGNILLNTETGEAQLVSGAVPFGTLKSAIDEMLAE